MRLRMLRYYIGWQSREQMIEAGEYAPDDPGLRGADPEYLVAQGFAEYILEDAPEAEAEAEPVEVEMEPEAEPVRPASRKRK